MAWLEADARNIASGWAPEPQLHAPEIGPTLAAILRNRIEQQALTQSAISDAIKAYQGRQSDAAYIQAAQNAGVLPQGDLSGMTAAGASNLAQRIQDQQQTSQEKYYDALTKILTDTGRRPPTGPLPAGQRPMTQGQEFQKLKTQESILGNQADTLEQQQSDYGLPADVPGGFGYMKNPDGTLRYATTQDEVANPDLVSPTDVLKGGKQPDWSAGAIDKNTGQPVMPFFTPQVYKQRQSQSDALKRILAEQDRVRNQMLNPQVANPQNLSQADVNQANQAQPDPGVTPTPIPYSQTIPTPSPAPSAAPSASPPAGPKIASNYGVKAVYMKAPDGTVSPVDPNLVEYYKQKGAVVVQGP